MKNIINVDIRDRNQKNSPKNFTDMTVTLYRTTATFEGNIIKKT